MTMPTKREKRQREYNHNFVSHQYTSFSFHSFVSILSKHRTCSLHKRQNFALSVHYFLLPPFVLIFFLSFLFFLLYRDTKDEKINHGCFFFYLAHLHHFFSRSHSRSRPSLLASHLLSSKLFLCLPGNLAVVMRRSAQPLGWWGWKKGKEVTRSCVGGGHRGWGLKEERIRSWTWLGCNI